MIFFCLLKGILKLSKLSKLDVTSLHCVFQMSPQMLMRISAHSLEAFVMTIHTAWPGLSIWYNDERYDGYASTLIVDIQQYLSK